MSPVPRPRSTVCLAAACILSASPLLHADEPNAELVQLVLNLLQDPDPDVRALGFEQVRSELPGTEATRQLAASLPKLPPDAQVGLLRALAERRDAAARPAVVELLAASREQSVRVAAIAALGPLGSAAEVPALVSFLAASDPGERAAARTSLQQLSGEGASAALAAELAQRPTPVRVALLEVLTARRATAALDSILPAALDADPALRRAALAALGALAPPERLADLVPGVLRAQPGPERDAAERALAQVCARIAAAEARGPALLAVLDALPADQRLALLPALGRVGGPAALQAVEAALADPQPAVHDQGLRALCNWPDASVAPRLIELAQREPHPDHQAQALAALIRVAPLPDRRPPAEKLALLRQALSLCTRDEQRNEVVRRARAVRTPETLRFLVTLLDQSAVAQMACESIVELAHHRELREAHKAEFHPALDRVIALSQDPVVVERAQRYKKNQTWARPKPAPAT
jgi:HEAT repeat protein